MPPKPFLPDPVRFGVGGLDLVSELDALPEGRLTRLQNLVQTTKRDALTQRPGQTSLATSAGTVLHSAKRLNDPQGATFTRLWGVDTDLHRAASGALGAAIEGGFSGDPLTFVPYRPKLSGDAFMFVGDRTKMRQVSGAFDTTIGLAPPTVAATAVAAAELRTTIDVFDANTNWAAGTSIEPPLPVGGPPAVPAVVTGDLGESHKEGTGALSFTTVVGSATGAYYNYWIKDLTAGVLNLAIVGGGTEAASDDDIVHLWMKIDRPDLVAAVQLYFITAEDFGTTAKPGGDTATPQLNEDFFVKTFRPADFQPFLDQVQDPQDIEEQTALSQDVLEDIGRHAEIRRRDGQPVTGSAQRRVSEESEVSAGLITAGRAAWNEFGGTPEAVEGLVMIPIRRGDFTRVGQTTSRDWSNINGLAVLIQVKEDTAVVVTLDDLYLTGGRGLDSSDVAAEPYDFVYAHFDPRTGDESNKSPVRSVTDGAITADGQILTSASNLFDEDDVGKAIRVFGAGEGSSDLFSTITAFSSIGRVTVADRAGTTVVGARVDWDGTGHRLELLRRAATVTPTAFGDAAIRQRIYRRGGTSNQDHFFEGQNGSDGGAFTATSTDLVVEATGLTAPIDHDQPVTTVNENGLIILAQAIPAIWGPLADYLFGCGDPFRPGHAYHSKRGEPGHWPPQNLVEVCSPAEELMHGLVYGGESFVFSRERLYRLVPDALGAGTVASFPTSCKKGLVARWAFTVGPGGIYFVTLDGIYVTRGGEPVSLTDRDLYGLFHGTAVNGLLSVDFTAITALRLTVHENELRFLYQDSGGTRRELVLTLLTGEWRFHTYGRPLALVTTEEDGPASVLIMGGSTTGDAYTHTGVTDDSVNITCQARTGARDQRLARGEKNYGDVALDVDRSGETLTLAPFINEEATALGTIAVSTLTGRQRHILDPFGTIPQRARNVSLDISWTSSGGGTPVLYLASLSYSPQPDTTVQRVTDWDDLGYGGEKQIKGVMLDCDTGNLVKTVVAEGTRATGAVTTISTLSVQTNGRRQIQFSWAAVPMSLVRVRPTDANAWLQEPLRVDHWIYDEESLRLTRWEVLPTDHGFPGWHYLLFGDITLDSSADVTLQVTAFSALGVSTALAPITIASTGSVRHKVHVTFNSVKGRLFSYLLTSSAAFYLYDWSTVTGQAWPAGEAPILLHPFGGQDARERQTVVLSQLRQRRQLSA